MEILIAIIRYAFVLALGVEGILIIRALVRLARAKAQTAPTTTE